MCPLLVTFKLLDQLKQNKRYKLSLTLSSPAAEMREALRVNRAQSVDDVVAEPQSLPTWHVAQGEFALRISLPRFPRGSNSEAP